MESLKATTHNADWIGTVGADFTNVSAIEDYLRKRGLALPRGLLVAIKTSIGDGHSAPRRKVNVRALFYDGQDFESIQRALAATRGPVPVREVTVDLTLEEFFEFFEDFDLTLTWPDAGFDGRQFTVVP